MFNFSQASSQKLASCHPDLQKLFNEVIKVIDCTIKCGHRNQWDQDKAYADGASKVKFPRSRHNKLPSLAVDVYPCPYNEKDVRPCILIAGIVFGTASQLGIKIRWGGNWDGDNKFNKPGQLNDMFHFEIIE